MHGLFCFYFHQARTKTEREKKGERKGDRETEVKIISFHILLKRFVDGRKGVP